ncbi:MAG: hemolysin family protein [Candidatus Nanopelagicales bacterium]
MSESVAFVVVATVAIIALSAFFVAVEFALMASKRHRLEDAAATSRSARAALQSHSELTLLLAGSQLGITVCTLALGAITKPAVHHWLTPVLEDVGLSAVVADVVAFLLALFIVTFLHLVIGEMAPKSWAIAHPERSATVLALPMRGFMALTRPLLRALNRAANALVRRMGVEPSDTVSTGQNPEDLRHLVEHSVNVGALDVGYSAAIAGALEMQVTPVRELLRPGAALTSVPHGATVGEVRDAARSTGHMRILVGGPGNITGVVHVRDTLAASDSADSTPFTRPVFTLDAGTTVHGALAIMRQTRNHLAIVTEDGRALGVVTLADVLNQLLPKGDSLQGAPSPLGR